MRINDAVMSLRFVQITIDGTVLGLRRLKCTAWPENGPTPVAMNISQERSSPRATGVLSGRNCPVLCKIEQDRVRVEDPCAGILVDDHRHLAIRIDSQKVRLVLLAFAGIHGLELIREAPSLGTEQPSSGSGQGCSRM